MPLAESSSHQLPLKVTSLRKYFGTHEVLKNIDLSMQAGECLVLVGANGAGKTTLLHILQGLISADKGTVELFGRCIQKQRRKILPLIGVMLQETSLYKRYTVEETLCLFKSFYPKTIPSWEPLLKLLNLDKKRHEYLRNLSGGERQKVYIATALIHQPKLLFLDEPTSALDPHTRAQIWHAIHRLKQEGCSILLTTHDMVEAENLADRLAILHQGQIHLEGTLHEIVPKFTHHTTISITASQKTPDFSKLIDTIRQHPQISEVKSNKKRLTIQWNKTDDVSNILTFLSSLSLSLDEVAIKKGNLVDVYLALKKETTSDAQKSL